MPDEYVRGEGRFPQSLNRTPADAEDERLAYQQALEAARPQGDAGGGDWSPEPAPPADYPMEGSGYSPEPPAPGPEYGPDPGRAQVNIGTASRFGTDWGPGENDFGVPGGQRVYGDLPPGVSNQPRIGWQMESQSLEQQRAAAAQAQAAQQAEAARRANPQQQLADLNRLIQQTALSQPEQMRLATLNQAVSQIQSQLDNGSINPETARQLHAQVSHNAEQLWARQGSLPQMLQRQAFLQAQHQAAEQASIQNMNAAMFTQHVQAHTATFPDGTRIYHNPVTGRETIIPPHEGHGQQQQDRAQAQAEQRHQNLVNRTQEHVLGELNRFETALHRWQANPVGPRPDAPHWMQNDSGQNYSRDFAVGEEVRRRVGQVHELAGTQPPTPRQGGQPGQQQGPGQPQGGGPAPQAPVGPQQGQPQPPPSPQQTTEMFQAVRQRVAQAPEAMRGQLVGRVDRNHELWAQYGSLAQMPEAERAEYLRNDVLVRRALAPAPPPRPWWASIGVR